MNQKQFTLQLASTQTGVTPQELQLLGVASPSKVVSRLRRDGACIYTRRTAEGTSYKVGKPTARMIAMAFSVAGPRAYM